MGSSEERLRREQSGGNFLVDELLGDVGLGVNQGCTNSILAAAVFMAVPFLSTGSHLAGSLPCCDGTVMRYQPHLAARQKYPQGHPCRPATVA